MPVEVASLSFFTFIFVKYSETTKTGGLLVKNVLVSITLQHLTSHLQPPKREDC